MIQSESDCHSVFFSDDFVDNAKHKLDLLINTFNQNYPFSEEHIELVERLLNDCLEELQYTKAARKLRQKTKRYEV